MDIIQCAVCNQKPKTRVKGGEYVCDDCTPSNSGVTTSVIEKVLLKNYGHVEKSRLNELNRRVIIPVEPNSKSGKDYYLGRRGENGKVQEKHPSY